MIKNGSFPEQPIPLDPERKVWIQRSKHWADVHLRNFDIVSAGAEVVSASRSFESLHKP